MATALELEFVDTSLVQLERQPQLWLTESEHQGYASAEPTPHQVSKERLQVQGGGGRGPGGFLVEMTASSQVWESLEGQSPLVDWRDARVESAVYNGTAWILVPHIGPLVSRPPLEVHASAQAHITDRVRLILDSLSLLLFNEARTNYVVATRTGVSAFRDPEEGALEIVVTQWVRLSPSEALEYWDRIGVVLENWSARLPEQLRRIAIERIAVEVQWDDDFIPVL